MSSIRARISLRVQPNAPRSEAVSLADGVFKIRIAAPPVEGKANRELIAFLSQKLGISKSSVTIVRGHTSRNKIIDIDGLSLEDITKRLFPKPSSSSPGAAATR